MVCSFWDTINCASSVYTEKKNKPHIHIYINPYKCVYYTLNNDVMAHCSHGTENVTVAHFSTFLLSNASLKPVEMFFSENLLKYSRIGLIQTWALYSSVTYLERLDCVCTICGFAQLRPKAISQRHISGTRYLPEPHAVLQLSEKLVFLHCLWTTVRQLTWDVGTSFLSLEGSPQMHCEAQELPTASWVLV